MFICPCAFANIIGEEMCRSSRQRVIICSFLNDPLNNNSFPTTVRADHFQVSKSFWILSLLSTVYEPVGSTVRYAHHRIWFKNLMANVMPLTFPLTFPRRLSLWFQFLLTVWVCFFKRIYRYYAIFCLYCLTVLGGCVFWLLQFQMFFFQFFFLIFCFLHLYCWKKKRIFEFV